MIDSGEDPRGEEMLLSRIDPESYITKYAIIRAIIRGLKLVYAVSSSSAASSSSPSSSCSEICRVCDFVSETLGGVP